VNSTFFPYFSGEFFESFQEKPFEWAAQHFQISHLGEISHKKKTLISNDEPSVE
jgi:hypothetical protein